MYVHISTNFLHVLYTGVLKANPESNWKEENQMTSCEQHLAFRVFNVFYKIIVFVIVLIILINTLVRVNNRFCLVLVRKKNRRADTNVNHIYISFKLLFCI